MTNPITKQVKLIQRKREDGSLGWMEDDSLLSLFDESSLRVLTKPTLMKNKGYRYPLLNLQGVARSNDASHYFRSNQAKVPKSRRITTPAYWGILDLTKDNLQEYFNGNCEITHDDDNDQLKKLHHNIQFMYLARFVFYVYNIPLVSSDHFTEKRICTRSVRAQLHRKVDMKVTLLKTLIKFEALFGEVAGGLGPFGIPSSCRKKRYLDKVKLAIAMRDSLNRILKDCLHISGERRKALVVYGWLQIVVAGSKFLRNWTGKEADFTDTYESQKLPL
ncbi:3306_t:CDS:2 [Paraglomus occultum]|uniref:3306_t:CDS:1 n=1 Tax=Paraglomus occultum TaxID=144539 RepID=A0A9N9AFV3_9GLOM|nr:3306_t:CDS:2 [Paraglomus occultum]